MNDFSLVAGGPFYQLLRRLGLTTPTRRIIGITLLAWLPLFVLSPMSFLHDVEAQGRFLIALPLLIAAEAFLEPRLRQMVGQFVDQGVITAKTLPEFQEIIAKSVKLRDSVVFEPVLFILLFVFGPYLGNTTGIESYWSRPLFQFIALRWYLRIFIWALFLWRTSRLELKLLPTHADRAGGLGFLGLSVNAFSLLILAHGVLLSSVIAKSIFFGGKTLPDYLLLITCVVLFVFFLILGGALAFSAVLVRTRQKGICEYGTLAARYASAFDHKWLRGGEGERLLGTSDIQSLADMGSSFQIVRGMSPFPFGKNAVFQLIFFTLLPVLPLVLTMIPLEELIKKFFQTIF